MKGGNEGLHAGVHCNSCFLGGNWVAGKVPDFSYITARVMMSRQSGKERIESLTLSLRWTQKQAERAVEHMEPHS